MKIGDDFLEDVIGSAAQIASHRKSKQLESKDVMLYLDRHYDLWVPGYTRESEHRPAKKDLCVEQHKQVHRSRIGLILWRVVRKGLLTFLRRVREGRAWNLMNEPFQRMELVRKAQMQ